MPLEIIRNDITKMVCDAIVNPTDSAMSGSGGTDFAVHAAAGPGLRKECDSLGALGEGQTAITHAFNLPCRYVIHTVGPQKDENGYVSYGALENCYRNSLALASEHGCQSIAFPLIATGTFGFPKDKGIDIAVKEIDRFLNDNEMLVYLVVHDEEGYSISKTLRDDIIDYIGEHSAPYADRMPMMNMAPAESDYYDRSVGQSRPKRSKLSEKLGKYVSPKAESNTAEALDDFDYTPGEERPSFSISLPKSQKSARVCAPTTGKEDLEGLLNAVDESFSEMLLRKIDEKNMTDAQCYKSANIDRRLFSRIRSDKNYRPSKNTALAFAIALKLPLEETKEMLMKAGYALSGSSKADIIVEYFIEKKIYDIFTINEALFEFDQALLGGSKGL